MIGQTIGHYRIVDKLGEGGMGVVYKARDAHLDRFVAVKTLLPGRVSDPERKRRFVREAKAASALNHPNIVAIYDIDQAEGLDYIAMEYVSGKTLDELIPRKGMRLSLALKYAVQIADALARAHSAGIVHRDLKPSNVMVDEHGVVKVLDFGLAKLIETGPTGSEAATRSVEATEARTVVGTVAYMSPEQAEGKEVDARSDIFAFGSLLYEMVSGRRAYEGTSATSTLAAVLHQEPKPLEDVPHDLDRAIARCLRKDPARRWQTMADLRVALQELCEESDSQPPGVAAPAIRRYRHRLLVALIALPLLVVAGWLYVNGSGHRLPPPALVQLTSSPGWEGYPSFSPDGRQVAFTWNGEKEDNVDIYVKLVGETTALRLTSDPAPESWPAWSPDGKRIAFERAAPGAPGIWLVSPLGGAEQKLADLETAGQMAWSPDGKWLAVGLYGSGEKTRGIVLVPVDGGEARRVTAREALGVDVDPSFSPDGRLLAYASCITLYSCDVFVQPLDAGYAPRGGPQRITLQSLAIDGLAWSHDGGSLIYGGSFSWNLSYRLWRVERSGGQQPERVDLAGPGASAPAVAPAGRRLAFSKSTSNLDVWRYQLGGVPEPFLRSSLVDMVAQFSPDGSRIVFASDRAGDVCDLWTVGADGSLPVQLTRGPGLAQSSPRWSPDGCLIAYDSRERDGVIRIYVIDANGGRPRRVSSVEPANAFVPSWSRDGKRIYFCSDRTGRGEVWRASLDGGAAEQVTENGGGLALESTDGRTLFYTKIPPPRIQGRFSPDPSMAVPSGKSWISSSTIHSPSSRTGSTISAGPVPTSSIPSSSTSSRPVPEASSRRLQARFFSRT